MGSPAIFKGLYTKLLAAAGIEFKDNTQITTSSTVDPSVTPTLGSRGSLWINTLLGRLFVKKDAGTTVNWVDLVAPAQVVTVGKSGAMFSTIQAAYDSITDASSSKIYAIKAAPGSYTEDVTGKDYVYLVADQLGTVTVVGKYYAALSGTAGIINILFQFTPTADNQIGVETVGGSIGITNVNVLLTGSADYICTGMKLSAGTGCTVRSSGVIDRRTGNITKQFTGIHLLGAGTTNVSDISASVRVAMTSGNADLCRIESTGNFTGTGGSMIFGGTATLSGTINGIKVLGATANARIWSGLQIKLTSTSGGTATASYLDSSGNNGRFDLTGGLIEISGFTTENSTNTGSTDSQRLYLTTTNKILAKAGLGLASLTPFDLVQTGFTAWAGSGAYYSFVPATMVFTLLRTCIGMVKGSQVYVNSGQSVSITNFATNFIYADSNGALAVTTDPGFDDKILLFSIYSDGTYFRVSKQTHPVSFPASTSGWAHNAIGSKIKNDANAILSILSGAGRTIQLTGNSTYYDHGLNTTIADSAGAAITMKMMYTSASGTSFQGAAFTAIPGVRQNGTVLSNISNGKFVNYRIGVFANSNLDDNTSSQIAQYIIVPDSTEHNSASAAAAQVTANTVAAFPAVAVGGLEVINIGFATIQGDGAGGGTLTVVTPAKDTTGTNFASGATTSAGSVTTDTSGFTGELNSSETSSQLVANRLDAYDSILDWALNKTYRVGNVVRVTEEGFIGNWRCRVAQSPTSGTFSSNLEQNSTSAYWEIASNSEGSRELINVPSHGFVPGTPLARSGSAWVAASCTTEALAEVQGIITGKTTNFFVMAKTGKVTISGAAWPIEGGNANLVDNTAYWLAATAGKITATKPTVVSYIGKPIILSNSTTTANFNNMRGDTIGGVNASTSIGLANNSTTTIHTINVPAGEGGAIEGVIKLDAATDYVTNFKVEFNRSVDGATYNITPQWTGTMPANFTITNSGAAIQVTVPDITLTSGTAKFNYSSIYQGATLPLSVSARSVLGDTSGTTVPAGAIGEGSTTLGTGDIAPGATGTYKTIVSQTLGAGTWLCSCTARWDDGTSDATGIFFGLSDTADTDPGDGYKVIDVPNNGGAKAISGSSRIFNKGASWVLRLNAGASYSTAGTGVWSAGGSKITYTRIA